jgi:glucoamylase
MRLLAQLATSFLAHMLAACALASFPARCQTVAQSAPDAPGEKPTWAGGNKQGVGTARDSRSKVWFTLAQGVLTEVYYPRVDNPNVRNLELVVTDGHSFVERESVDTRHEIQRPDPAALIFRQVNTSLRKHFQVTKTYITDPASDTVLVRVHVKSYVARKLHIYLLYDPSLNNSGLHNSGYSQDVFLVARGGDVSSALACSVPFVQTTSGFLGTSDGWKDLKHNFRLTHVYRSAEDGNLVQTAQLPATATGEAFTIALSFGKSPQEALHTAKQALHRKFSLVEREYAAGWHGYINQLTGVDREFRDLYWTSAMVLKAHEDKMQEGAIVASLAIPWGPNWDASAPVAGGYHLVWSRDLYQAATALLAMGDRGTAEHALDYLFNVQQRPDGSFPQNSWLDGRAHWTSLQMDEVAFPLVLAYQLGRTDSETYDRHVRPAAEFIVRHGPVSPQERWEEISGYSPSTIAAEIAGLVCAAYIADVNHDPQSATLWRTTARSWKESLGQWTVAMNGPLGSRYFVRSSKQGDPNAGTTVAIGNGGGIHREDEIVDLGFLELVRLGILAADNTLVHDSLAVADQVLRVETPKGPGWHRYNYDGYGEQASGAGHDGISGVGRLWVILTGERAEYAVAAGEDAKPLARTMQRMANAGGMLPEQVWDRKDAPMSDLKFGEGTGSATPLVWSHAQFIRLVIAVRDHDLPETPQAVSRFFLEEK